MRGPRAEFQVADADALSGDVNELVNRFTKQLSVDDAKEIAGSLMLSVPAFDPDPRPNWAIPEFRRYIANVDRALPHFPFFLVASPMIGQVKSYLSAITPIADPVAMLFRSDQILEVAERKADDVARYAEALGLDPDDAAGSIYINLHVQLIKDQPVIVALFEKAMRPVLDRARKRLPADGSLMANEREVLAEVAQLYDIDAADYESDSELINDVLERMPPAVTSEALHAFDQALDGLVTRVGNGKIAIQSGPLVELVRSHQDAANAFVDMHVRMGASQPGYLRTASLVAAAIEIAFNDRWPMSQVEQRAAELGLEPEEWTPGVFEDLEAAKRG